MKIKSQTQPIENAEVFDIYSNNRKIAVRLVADKGFELVKEGEGYVNITTVDIPAMYEERVCLYTAIPWVEKTETPDIDEPETETEATETDYINALKELGVNFNE